MLVTFVRDFRGVASHEQYYTKGTVADLGPATVRALLAEGVVEMLPDPVITVTSPVSGPVTATNLTTGERVEVTAKPADTVPVKPKRGKKA